MGYQHLHDTSGSDHNKKAQESAQRRTSTTAAKAQDTTKAQYDRLTGSGRKVVPTGDQVGRGTI